MRAGGTFLAVDVVGHVEHVPHEKIEAEQQFASFLGTAHIVVCDGIEGWVM